MACLLATAGGMLAGVSGAGSKALLTSAAAIFAGGPFAWIGAALVGASLYAIGTVGTTFFSSRKRSSLVHGNTRILSFIFRWKSF